ncbi:AAA family ATPase [Oerskovia enterophila]|uniref:AAA family ATPase n=1 Tax=Oerskovia enterophila TaxID=43678 RepID=UPI00380E1B58
MWIESLSFTGPSAQEVRLQFGPRLNVVHGPSDTGKSFIADSIGFMLGGSRLKQIPESSAYDDVHIAFTATEGRSLKIQRSTVGGKFFITTDGGPRSDVSETFAAGHNAKKSYSTFLLSELGINGVMLRKNALGETQKFTIRTLAHFSIIDETKIQDDEAPALSGIPTSRTAETSALRYLLDGQDDSRLESSAVDRTAAAIGAAKTSGIEAAIYSLRESATTPFAELSERAEIIDLRLDVITQDMQVGFMERDRVLGIIQTIESSMRNIDAKLGELKGLEFRFELLEDQYRSDLERLALVEEFGSLLNYLTPGSCPFCGASVEHQHRDGSEVAVPDMSLAVVAERTETSALLRDLSDAKDALANEISGLEDSWGHEAARLTSSHDEFGTLDSQLTPSRGELAALAESRAEIAREISIHEQIERLESLIVAEDPGDPGELQFREISPAVADRLSHHLVRILDAWGYPEAQDVRFDRTTLEIFTGDQPRKTHGKGVRALLHAAFTVALAEYCFEAGTAHPGFIVLDSPLVTYRAADEGRDAEGLSPEVGERFYRYLDRTFPGQSLVLENMAPTIDVMSDTTVIEFSKNLTIGRYGLFPNRS